MMFQVAAYKLTDEQAKNGAHAEFIAFAAISDKNAPKNSVAPNTRGNMTYHDNKIFFNPPLKLTDFFGQSVVKKAMKFYGYEKEGEWEKTRPNPDTGWSAINSMLGYAGGDGNGFELFWISREPGFVLTYGSVQVNSKGEVLSIEAHASSEAEKTGNLWPEALEDLSTRPGLQTNLFLKMGFTQAEIDKARQRAAERKSAEKFLKTRTPTDWRKFSPYEPVGAEIANNVAYVHMTEIGIQSPESTMKGMYLSGLDLCSGVIGVVKDKKTGNTLRTGIAHFAPGGGAKFSSQFAAELTDGFEKKNVKIELYVDINMDSDGLVADLHRGLKGVAFEYKYLYFPKGDEYDRATTMYVSREGQVLLNPRGLKREDFSSDAVLDYADKYNKLPVTKY